MQTYKVLKETGASNACRACSTPEPHSPAPYSRACFSCSKVLQLLSKRQQLHASWVPRLFSPLQEEQHKDHRIIRVGKNLHLGQLSPTKGRELAPLDAQGHHVPPPAATQVRSELRFPSWTRSPLKMFTNNADNVDYF